MIEKKFRVWDDDIQRMFYPDGVTIIEIIQYSDECVDRCWLLDTHHVIEQFTGFRDKNNKKIFEGDIIRNNSQDNQTETVGLQPNISVSTGHGDSTYSANIECFGGWGNGTDVEIIGNIHEQ